MTIEIKKSIKPIEYKKAIRFLEERLALIKENKKKELIWVLQHPKVFTAGKTFKENEILDKSINLIKTNRGGKITYHCPGQIICYFVLDLNKKSKDIRKFVNLVEKVIIKTLEEYGIKSFNDPKNIGIWVKHGGEEKKVAAIGIRVSKWIAYHGFSINVDNNLNNYKKIIPCGIKDKSVINLKKIKDQNYSDLDNKIINNFLKLYQT